MLTILFFLWPLLMLMLVGVTAQSLVSLITAPKQLWSLAKDKARRRNHSLEHATINVIEEKYGPTQLAGLAYPDGFTLQGAADPQLILNAAREALRRLKEGEKHLAWHPRCGTTMLAANLVTAVSFIVLLIVIGRLSILTALLAIAIAALLSKPVGMLLQRFITTSSDVGNLQITDFEYSAPRGWAALFASMPTEFRVHTAPGWTVLTPDEASR